MSETTKTALTLFQGNLHGGDSATCKQDGWTLQVAIHADDTPDTSFYGEFSDTPEPGRIDHHATDTWLDRSYRGLRYFNPCNHDPDDPQSPEANLKDYQRMVDYHHGYWSMVGIEVTALRQGIPLGSASLWGTESDCGDADIEEIIREELGPEAIAEAEAKLKSLCACEDSDG